MIDVSLTFPLTLGLVAAFNPCGFAMLPAYLSYFLGLESGDEATPARNVVRALAVSAVMTAGFVLVFASFGIITETLISAGTIQERLPWATLGFGVLMVPLGIAMVRGFEPKVSLPRLTAGTGSRELPSIFLFGVSYATISISCTAPLFFGVIIGSFSRDGVVDGVATFVAYAVGMGLVITVLTMGLALARAGVARSMRRFLPYVTRVSGGILVVAGVCLALYGWWELRVLRNADTADDPVADAFARGSARIDQWIRDVGGRQVALAIVVVVVATLVLSVAASRPDPAERRMLRGGLAAVYLVLEFGVWRADLLCLPLLRTIADIPERVQHWFTDPLRWPVVFELLAAVVTVGIAAIVWSSYRHRHQQRAQVGVG